MTRNADRFKRTEYFKTYAELKHYLNDLFVKTDFIVEIHVRSKRDTGLWFAEYRDQDEVNKTFLELMKNA